MEALQDLFSRCSGATERVVNEKFHSEYFRGYFTELNAQTIIAEHPYVDRDYLEDYASYYVKCFNPPKSSCVRLHFFSTSFKQSSFTRFLKGTIDKDRFVTDSIDSRHYLGFIVIKPLPKTFIGRTCLKTYPTDGTGRQFPARRRYEVNLFGHILSVDSLAFEEQDNEVAQCATSALWSVFQGTSTKFGHPVVTPVEITKLAREVHGGHSRMFPTTDGLTIVQLADAIRKMKLEPYCTYVADHSNLQSQSYAYLQAGIPALLTVSLWDKLDSQGNLLESRRVQPPVNYAAALYGETNNNHAVALTGFHLSDSPPTPFGSSGILLKSSRIDKIYVHDDQIGAFARQELSAPGTEYTFGSDDDLWTSPFMSTSWSGAAKQRGSILACAGMLIVPLYPKMRVPFGTILKSVIEIDSLIEFMRLARLVPDLNHRLEWDIFLTSSNELKSDILSTSYLQSDSKLGFLTSPMPRFVWRAIAMHNDIRHFEFIFDATDIMQGKIFLRPIEYVDNALSMLRHPAALANIQNLGPIAGKTVEWANGF